MSDIACFLLEDTGRENHYLRRYSKYDDASCGGAGYHSAMLFTRLLEPGEQPKTTESDPRWPATCRCGYVFTEEDGRQDFKQNVYRRTDTGQEMEVRAAPAGAMWFSA